MESQSHFSPLVSLVLCVAYFVRVHAGLLLCCCARASVLHALIRLSKRSLKALLADPRVKYVEADGVVSTC
jgi:hypothetical protein